MILLLLIIIIIMIIFLIEGFGFSLVARSGLEPQGPNQILGPGDEETCHGSRSSGDSSLDPEIICSLGSLIYLICL